MTTATVVTDLKSLLKFYIEKAGSGGSIIITRSKRKNAVLIGEDEYNEHLRIKQNVEYMEKINLSVFRFFNEGKL